MVDVAGQAVVAILTRAPSAGGKSRLFAALGRPPDPDLLAALFLDTLDAVGNCPGTVRVVCFTPDGAEAEMRAIVPPGVDVVAQASGDLGDRMHRAFEQLLGAGARTVVLIGSDLPLIDPAAVDAAHAYLREHPDDVVIGPAVDGGYYLVGAARLYRWLFSDMRWWSPTVCTETLARAAARGVGVRTVGTGADVDTPDDLRRVALAADHGGRRTRAWVARSL